MGWWLSNNNKWWFSVRFIAYTPSELSQWLWWQHHKHCAGSSSGFILCGLCVCVCVLMFWSPRKNSWIDRDTIKTMHAWGYIWAQPGEYGWIIRAGWWCGLPGCRYHYISNCVVIIMPKPNGVNRTKIWPKHISVVSIYCGVIRYSDRGTQEHISWMALLAVRIFPDEVTWPYILIARGRERRLALSERRAGDWWINTELVGWSLAGLSLGAPHTSRPAVRPSPASQPQCHFSTRLVFMESTALHVPRQ